MQYMRTHYDELGARRNATPQEIEKAFWAKLTELGRLFPPGDPLSEVTTGIVRESFAVLSDPARRAEHDEWIRQN
jgi:curved DNA-binding protein CbpA